MHQWVEFYSVIGAASAALLGLLFVTISTSAHSALESGHQSSKRMAEQAFQNYLAVLMVSLLALFPNLSVKTFGFSTLCGTGVWVIWVILRLYLAIRQRSDGEGQFQILHRHLSSMIGFGILVVTALRMAMAWGDDLNLFAAATMVLLFSATRASWNFLLQVADRSSLHRKG